MAESLWRFALVGTGGMLGSMARYGLSAWAHRWTAMDFPIGTLLVNVVGSFVMGWVLASSLERGVPGPAARLLLTTGFCGGFTTMSAFSYETFTLAESAGITAAATNVVVTFTLCMVAVWMGLVFGGRG